jgi:benzoyl-CoA reductase/2-hydroxyglutaryl-CoA dehydratase subunit BcrC/BadD/HgdB
MSESDSWSHLQISVGINEFNEMISQLKEKFKKTVSRSEKLKILTVPPKVGAYTGLKKSSKHQTG